MIEHIYVLGGVAAREYDPQLVVENFGDAWKNCLEHAGGMRRGPGDSAPVHDVNGLRRRLAGSDDERPLREVRPEDRERIGMPRAGERVEVGVTCHSH